MQGRVISHYSILERLGGGGMGVVYKALDTKLDRYVALKFLSAELHRDENSKKRFIHEAKATSALDHPNICTIYEIDETDDNLLFIAMAYYEGETLKRKLQSTPIPLSLAANIATQIAAGLAKAHSQNIIHRDIKPGNIMITPDRTVKIVDFGLAKLSGQTDLTRSGSALGTAAYMSPEQAQGQHVDQRTDVWSWGVVLYEMLTGELPFRGDNHLALFHSIVKAEPPAVSKIRNDLPAGFDRLIARTLAKDPTKRLSSISEAAEELHRFSASTQLSVYSTHAQTIRVDSGSALSPRVGKKQIAVLKCLIPRFADLLEHLSGAELQLLLNKLLEAITKVAEDFQGIVNDFSGEEATLVFGIPNSDEHDLLRAVRAATALNERIAEVTSEYGARIGDAVQSQCGIAAGLVVVRLSHSADHKYELTGNAVQTAVALADHAETGEVWISEETRRSLERFFQTESREEIRVKGKGTKMRPYRVTAEAEQGRFDSWTKEELSTYTGREKELQMLREKLQAAQRGEGQFVAVIGEAGSGKSRLLYEFRRSLASDRLRVLQGGSHLYAGNVAYAPFIEVLKEDLHLRGKENSDEFAAEQIQKLNPSLLDFLSVYLHLLGIPSAKYALPKNLQGKELQLSITEALCAFVLSKKDGGVLLMLEDWQAADEASRNILEQLQEMIPDSPILIIATCRPECTFRSAAHHTTLYLKPLDSTSSKTIMQSVLCAEVIPAELVELVLERTGGNPFFIEEICRTLLEEDTIKVENREVILTRTLERLRLPDTIQSVIGSRLDRIEASTRSILEIASVIGREFNRSLLQKLNSDESELLHSLEGLKELGLIQQVRVLPEATYRFKHPLMQETAYAGLLAHERKRLHGAVGEAIEQLYTDRLEENFGVLAQHFSVAENWEKAIHYARESAQKAITIGEFAFALRQLQRAEEWLTKLTETVETQHSRIEMLMEEERLCETLGIRERQEEILTSVLSQLQQTDDRSLLMEAYRRLGELFTVIGRFDDAENALNRSLEISLQIGDTPGERNAHRSKGFLYWNQGRSEEAVSSNQLALAIDRNRNDSEGLARDLLNLAPIFRGMGRNQEARESALEALKIFESGDDPVKQATALHVVGTTYRDSGDNERALEYLQASLEISSRSRRVVTQTFQLNAIANLYWQQGKINESLQLLHQAVENCRKSGYAEGLAHSMRTTGELLFNSNREEEALPALQEAASLFSKLKDAPDAALMFGMVASVHEKAGRNVEAIDAWKEASEWRRKMNDSQGLFTALEALGRLCRQAGDVSAAIDYYRQALQTTAKEETKASLLNTLGILEWNLQNYPAALDHFRNALALFEEIGDFVHAGLMWNSIGVSLKHMDQKEQAIDALQRGIEMHHQTGERLLEGHALSALGQIYFESGKLTEAEECFRKSLEIRKAIADRKGEGWMHYQLGVIYTSQNSESLARESLKEAARIAEECGEPDLIRACRELQT